MRFGAFTKRKMAEKQIKPLETIQCILQGILGRVGRHYDWCIKLLFGQRTSLVLHFGQKITLLKMRRPKRSVSDLPCSDEYKRTVSEGTRSCAEVMSSVIEDCKSPNNLIWYMFGQFSGFLFYYSPSSRPTHVGTDQQLFHQRSSLGHSSSNRPVRWHGIEWKNRWIFYFFDLLSVFYLWVPFPLLH